MNFIAVNHLAFSLKKAFEQDPTALRICLIPLIDIIENNQKIIFYHFLYYLSVRQTIVCSCHWIIISSSMSGVAELHEKIRLSLMRNLNASLILNIILSIGLLGCIQIQINERLFFLCNLATPFIDENIIFSNDRASNTQRNNTEKNKILFFDYFNNIDKR